jgi:hypothetical protein
MKHFHLGASKDITDNRVDATDLPQAGLVSFPPCDKIPEKVDLEEESLF